MTQNKQHPDCNVTAGFFSLREQPYLCTVGGVNVGKMLSGCISV